MVFCGINKIETKKIEGEQIDNNGNEYF